MKFKFLITINIIFAIIFTILTLIAVNIHNFTLLIFFHGWATAFGGSAFTLFYIRRYKIEL